MDTNLISDDYNPFDKSLKVSGVAGILHIRTDGRLCGLTLKPGDEFLIPSDMTIASPYDASTLSIQEQIRSNYEPCTPYDINTIVSQGIDTIASIGHQTQMTKEPIQVAVLSLAIPIWQVGAWLVSSFGVACISGVGGAAAAKALGVAWDAMEGFIEADGVDAAIQAAGGGAALLGAAGGAAISGGRHSSPHI